MCCESHCEPLVWLRSNNTALCLIQPGSSEPHLTQQNVRDGGQTPMSVSAERGSLNESVSPHIILLRGREHETKASLVTCGCSTWDVTPFY